MSKIWPHVTRQNPLQIGIGFDTVLSCDSLKNTNSHAVLSIRSFGTLCQTVAGHGVTSSPATMKTNYSDLVGKKFGRLKAVILLGKSKNNMWLYGCICDCGKSKVARGSHLARGEIKSCGCFRREHSALTGAEHATTHGHSFTGTYGSWAAMKFRCTNPKHVAYAQYGGRGIKVCDRWFNSFENFLADMGERPIGMTLDREDVNGDYEPSNCKWSTHKQQSRNIRSNRHLTVNGVTHLLCEWAEITGISDNTIRERLKRGWSPERAVGHA